MKLLNERHDYGLELFLLSVDEGITGYRDDSLETVKRNSSKDQFDLPLKIVSYEQLYGWTMDAIVQQIGLKNNCAAFPFSLLFFFFFCFAQSTLSRHILRRVSAPGTRPRRHAAGRQQHCDGPQRGRHRRDGADEQCAAPFPCPSFLRTFLVQSSAGTLRGSGDARPSRRTQRA